MPQPRNYRRWSVDTRIAFLLALRLTGGVTRAAREIGRVRDACYGARKRDPAFAAAWDAIVAAQAAERAAARVVAKAEAKARAQALSEPDAGLADERDASGNRARRTGLTQLKRRAFLRALTEVGTVERACARVGVSDTAVYRLRGADQDFAAAWDRALATAQPLLEQVVWERAVEGWEEPVWQGGRQVGTRRRFSETLLRQLVLKREKAVALADDPAELERRAHEAAKAAGGFFSTPATREETNATLMKKLKAIEGRLGLPPPPFGDGGADGADGAAGRAGTQTD